MVKKIVLTGDRPTGPLHLGHYVGSLANRIVLQDQCDQYVMLADVQALTDHMETPEKVRDHIHEVLLDYLSIGLDPQKTTFFLQSKIPALFELTIYYLNLVTWNRLKHNPTVKLEIRQKGMGENVPAGFMVYPISQAADITAFKANLVPVGEDQIPMVEQTIEIVGKFNRIYHTDVLVEPEIMLPSIARLPGTDGQAKMAKTLRNAIFLSDHPDVIAKKVRGMYTAGHLHVDDPGEVKSPVFIYLDAFDPDKEKLEEMKAHYQRGGLGDSVVKKRLLEVLMEFLEPIQKKRRELEKDIGAIDAILKKGTEKANSVAEKTLADVRQAMKIDY